MVLCGFCGCGFFGWCLLTSDGLFGVLVWVLVLAPFVEVVLCAVGRGFCLWVCGCKLAVCRGVVALVGLG